MMILVGVTVSVVMQGGLFDKATIATIKQETATMQEYIAIKGADMLAEEAKNIGNSEVESEEKDLNVTVRDILQEYGITPTEIEFEGEIDYISNADVAPEGTCYLLDTDALDVDSSRGNGTVQTGKDIFVVDSNKRVYYIRGIENGNNEEEDKEHLEKLVKEVQGDSDVVDLDELDQKIEEDGRFEKIPEESTDEKRTYENKENGNKLEVDVNGKIRTVSDDQGGDEIGTITALPDDGDPLTIGAVEDLVDITIAVKSGETFEGETVTLLTSLDLSRAESYRNAKDTTLGDLNGIENDGNEIMTEMTTGAGFEPIGMSDAESGEAISSFKGSFDGQGNTISELYINRPEGVASLFGAISANSTIENIKLKNPEIKGLICSGLVTAVNNETNSDDVLTIKNCHSDGGTIGAVNGECMSVFANGLIYATSPYSNIEISNCSNNSGVEGYSSCGLGYVFANNVMIEKCTNYADLKISDLEAYMENEFEDIDMVVGCFRARGLESATVTECLNKGDLYAYGSDVAGVCETGGGTVTNCSNEGNIYSYYLSLSSYVAGIAVTPNYDMTCGDQYVTSCVNKGKIMVEEPFDSVDIAGIYSGKRDAIISECSNENDIEILENNLPESTNTEEMIIAGISSNDVKSITNCSNKGNIIVDSTEIFRTAAYGIGNPAGNCYNVGEIRYTTTESNDKYAFGIGNGAVNCYNLGTISAASGNAFSIGENSTNCHELTGNENPETVKNALNSNREDACSEWVIVDGKNNGYPIFSWENVE